MMKGLLDLLMELVYPPRPKCGLCSRVMSGGTSGELCQVCREELAAWHGRLFPCGCCGRLSEGASSGLCPDCLEGPPVFAIARAVGPYQGVLKDAVQRFKYGGGRRLAGPLGRMMAGVVLVEAALGCVDAVVPVPLSVGRLLERGYNQSALLAVELAGILGKPVVSGLLVKTRETPSQTHLSRADRLRNPAGAFTVPGAVSLGGQRVLLVDDIFTTGATAGECARALTAAGAARVAVVTVATALARRTGADVASRREDLS